MFAMFVFLLDIDKSSEDVYWASKFDCFCRGAYSLLFGFRDFIEQSGLSVTFDFDVAQKAVLEFKTKFAEDIKKLEAFYGIELKVEFGACCKN